MSERYMPGDPTPEAARELIPDLYRHIDLLEALAAKREALYDRDGELIDLGHADGLRDAAQRLRHIIAEAEKGNTP